MLNHVTDARVVAEANTGAGAQDDLPAPAQLRLSHRILPNGQAVVDIGGELDIATADVVVRYVSHVIDSRCRAVTVDLTALGFCDAAGLTALLRMVGYAQQAACPFCLASPSPSLIKIMRVTGLARRLLTPTHPQRAACLPEPWTSKVLDA
jgi:anti-anti-sigma factor